MGRSVQSRRVHLFIVNCLLQNKFNVHVVRCSLLFIYLRQHYTAKFSSNEYNLIKVYNKLVVIKA